MSFKVKEIPPLHTPRTSSYQSGDIPVNRVGPSTPRRKDFHAGLSNDVGDFDSPASSHSMLETPNSTQNSLGKQRDDDIIIIDDTDDENFGIGQSLLVLGNINFESKKGSNIDDVIEISDSD